MIKSLINAQGASSYSMRIPYYSLRKSMNADSHRDARYLFLINLNWAWTQPPILWYATDSKLMMRARTDETMDSYGQKQGDKLGSDHQEIAV